MKEKINKAITKTNGKKTESLGLLMVLFQAFLLVKPDLLDNGTEKAITMVIGSGIIPALAHRIWRNRKEINKYTSNKIAWLKKALNRDN